MKVCISKDKPWTSFCVVFDICCDFCIFNRLARGVEMTNLDACNSVGACNSMCDSLILNRQDVVNHVDRDTNM